mmetsp:Transcript_3852/g.8294  ORF Transcript_3852/g.8294 Transcript_3852/m.8294 type:complete len:269 (+) Transcript_3852:718-1524(+)|eukprot:CAMPEP_0168176542 /NCGR_PEP_ID=MMETSP0139_2-20121125/7854_1 /TAXON_ID=44445 /ORGANISM="Pseudo-nitzschia australis, Strain 10249 10 AB" /LENGTH=268 /DNA_ID=CAMNT_0008095289 /DNA_START=590 /DNA_END=1396 /DNA_ORIENTATION=+
MSYSSAARTNLSSTDVRISSRKLGEGAFRVCLEGHYVGGNRNNQEAACKRFKPMFRSMEDEYFAKDFEIADVAIVYAENWNNFCESDEIILITKGHIIHSNSGIRYLAEPLIRGFTKFTSNNGWIDQDEGWTTEAMEAFSHYTYHCSGGNHLVCDLQGRYRDNRNYRGGKSRFELTDVAICSRTRCFGPTDLCEKGIETFFHNHVCNQFCNHGRTWLRPYSTRDWFPRIGKATSMFPSFHTPMLYTRNRAQYAIGVTSVAEEDDSDDW